MDIKVSAIIVTYNRLELLKNCLKHLMNQSYPLNSIIIINNNSSDGTESYLNRLNSPLVKYKNLSKNVGGSGGFSMGTRYAYQHTNSNFFWLMDDDSIPTINSLSHLINSAKKLNYKFGFLSSNIRSNRNNSPVNLPMVSKDWSYKLPGNLVKIDRASFVSLFVSRYIVSRVGLPIRQMFIWGDDYDYTIRISRRYKSYFVSNSIVMHNSSANTNVYDSENIFNSNRPQFYKYSYRNYLYIARKHYGYKKVIKQFIHDIITLIEIPFKSKDKRCLRFYYAFIGIIKGISFNPKIEYLTDNQESPFNNER